MVQHVRIWIEIFTSQNFAKLRNSRETPSQNDIEMKLHVRQYDNAELGADGIQCTRVRIYVSRERMFPRLNDSTGQAYILERS